MAVLQYGTTQTFLGGPIYLQSLGSGNLAIFDDVANGDSRLYQDIAGVVTQVGSSTFDAGGFVRLTDGSYLVYRQEFDLTYGGAHYEVLNALGAVTVPDSDVVGTTGRPIAGPSATATSGGGFFIGYTDGQNANGSDRVSFSPPDENNNTAYNVSTAGDAGYRYFTPTGVAGTYQAGDFETANTGTFTTIANGGSTTGSNTAGQQSVSGVATLSDGTVVESYVNQYFFPEPNGGADSANEIVVRLITGSGASDPITVSQLQIPSGPLDEPNYAVRGNGGIQVVALPTGFAVIWHEDHVVNDASGFSGYRDDGYDTKIRYFNAIGSPTTDSVLLYHQSNDTSAADLYASADSLEDGRIALVYDHGDLAGANETGGTQLSVGVIGVLGSTFTSSTITPDLTSGLYQSNWDLASTGGGNIAVSYTSTADGTVLDTYATDIACYCRGTEILTANGGALVEDLAIGDLLVTASGALRPVRWIGQRAYAGRFANANRDVLPICFKAGSLDVHVPRRDLWVSPKHAMFLNGLLIPAEHLVNDVSITQAVSVDVVEYFHIELDSHDVIVAEGALSETFVDDLSRGMFHNAHDFAALYPDAEPVEAVYCAPRIEEGFKLEAVRRRLAERAGLQDQSACALGALRGWVEEIDGGRVVGWAQSEGCPNAPVCLDVLVDGVAVAQVVAGTFRHDLLAAGIGDGCHAFEARVAAVPSGAVSVRRSADHAALRRLPCATEALTRAA